MEMAISNVLGFSLSEPLGATWQFWVQQSRNGLPKRSLDHLQKELGLTLNEIAELLPVSARTLQRYSKDKILGKDLTGHIIAIANVLVRAVEVFEDSDKARRWLSKPCRALGGEIPFSLLDSPLGIQAVHDELVRIEYGVYY